MKKYLKMPRAVRLATLFAMIPALFLGGCGQQTECEKSIDTAMGTVISQTEIKRPGTTGTFLAAG